MTGEVLSQQYQFSRPVAPPRGRRVYTPQPAQSSPVFAGAAVSAAARDRYGVTSRQFLSGFQPEECPYLSLPIVLSASKGYDFSATVYDFVVSFFCSRNSRPDRIVISGFGCLTPLGNSRDELWSGFRNARSGISRISAFDPSGFRVQIAGQVRGIDPYDFFHAKERPHVSRSAALAIAAARQAIEDARLNPETLTLNERRRVGVL